MKFSPAGVMVITLGLLVGIVMWVVGYLSLPNADTHKILSANPPIATSVSNTASKNSTTGVSGGSSTAASAWYSLDKSAKNTLDVTLSGNSNNGLNFNGYSNGALIITVPTGWAVKATFVNADANMPHSLGFISWANKQANTYSGVPAAFKGSLGPQFTSGMQPNAKSTFSFSASTAGKYAFVCGVPGHAAGGMWDEFDVSSAVKAPTIKTPQGLVTVK